MVNQMQHVKAIARGQGLPVPFGITKLDLIRSIQARSYQRPARITPSTPRVLSMDCSGLADSRRIVWEASWSMRKVIF